MSTAQRGAPAAAGVLAGRAAAAGRARRGEARRLPGCGRCEPAEGHGPARALPAANKEAAGLGWGGPDRGGLLGTRRVHRRSSCLVRRGHRCVWSPLADTQRALRLLEEYRSKLSQAEDRQLRNSIERVISIFQSNLFQALIGKR